MKYFLLLFSCVFLKTATAQDIYPLHPAVGDTIDLNEKLDYSLFPGIYNTGFRYATIEYQKDKFVLLVNTLDTDEETQLEIESVYTIDLSQEQIIEEQQKIQKVNAYYRLMAEEKLKKKDKTVYEKSKKSHPIRMNAMSEQMKKEARMNIRLKEDERFQKEFEMGLRPRQMRIEFK